MYVHMWISKEKTTQLQIKVLEKTIRKEKIYHRRQTPVYVQSTKADFSDRLEFQLAHRGMQLLVKQSNYCLEQMFLLENNTQPETV